MSRHNNAPFDPPAHLAAGLVSPQQVSSPTTTLTPDGAAGPDRKRKRTWTAQEHGDGEHTLVGGAEDGRASSSGTLAHSPGQNGNKPRHQPGVKRACNDCRQQKLRCNVVAGPGEQYKPCDRCVKHGLHCSIDDGFKRLGKRAAHEEMVKELDRCKQKLARYEQLGMFLPEETPGSAYNGSYQPSPDGGAPAAVMGNTGYGLGASEAAASRSLLDLSQGYRELVPTTMSSITPGTSLTTLGGNTLTEQQLTDLYQIYFDSYHPFMPVLNADLSYKAYYDEHPLLHWTIVAIAARRQEFKPGLFMELQRPLEELLWTTLSQVPQSYHVTKALALLCTWPLPTSSTSQEPTMMLCGIMFQLAMQHGLHRPSHAQDFSRFRVDLRDEDVADRLNTWAAVNIVAQNVSTGNGQPPLARWAWFTYGLHLGRMKPELHTRCQIEKFNDTVTRTLYTMQRDHIVEVDQAQRGLQIDMYARELGELEVTVLSTGKQNQSRKALEVLFLKAAALHLRLTAFFDKPSQPDYHVDLRNLYIAASALLEHVSAMSTSEFAFVPRYIEQMMLAASVTLLKILHSFYAKHVDNTYGKTLFTRAVAALRKLSVRSNDLPQRLTEVMAQLWISSGSGEQDLFKTDPALDSDDDTLALKVRCRSSLSVLYDAIWRWRERAGQAGRENLVNDIQNPTRLPDTSRNTPQPPDGTTHNALADVHLTQPSSGLQLGQASDLDALTWDQSFGPNAVFDPLSWALDGNIMGLTNPMFEPNGALSMPGYPG
ncbi:hypothetical protein CBER1_09293 [Cercospora berteroae]|uniref:Zn(2)-C6 fungal-type domain-containing protein n=1 Tax=Cercospora berteroae TaxID=357750 RepID=A0A2S6CFC9_9PEZI|nr:hypothetical protein CBER1_09293 [Cercospora berteroae]